MSSDKQTVNKTRLNFNSSGYTSRRTYTIFYGEFCIVFSKHFLLRHSIDVHQSFPDDVALAVIGALLCQFTMGAPPQKKNERYAKNIYLLSFPFPSPPSPPLLSSPPSPPPPPSLPSFLPLPPSSPPVLLEVGPFNPARGSGERCKLPQRGPGQTPGRQRIFARFPAEKTHLVVTILPRKGAQNIPLIPAFYALLNLDDGSDHPKSNLLGRVRPGRSPVAKSISLQKNAV